MLKDLSLKLQYRSNIDNLYHDFYEKCLQNAKTYDRAAGYFTSQSLQLLARGLDLFLLKDGKIRIVANPKLTDDDMKAIEKGHIAQEEVIEKRLLNEVQISKRTIEDDTLNVLSWLIYTGQLEIKIAFTKNNSIYHEKFGVFSDESGESISFSGSANETFSGLSQNFEKIDVYFGDKDRHRIENSINDFNELWNDSTAGLKVIDLPTSIKNKLLSYKTNDFPIKNVNNHQDEIKPRDYQLDAIKSWEESGRKGILEMATGTGKTITSLLAAKNFMKLKRGFLVIIVPFQHLVEQWSEDINLILGFEIIKCMESKKKWKNKLIRDIQDFNLGLKEEFIIVTTYKTASSTEFKSIMKNISGDCMLISDECHYITKNMFTDFPFEKFIARLGLSATPDRWWDENGTDFLKESLGNVVYKYTLEQAIENNKLTEYYYYPHIVEFSEIEMKKYNNITKKIVHILQRKNEDNEKDDENLTQLYMRRVNLINKAANKMEEFINDLKKEDLTSLKHTLVYCAKGEIDTVVKRIYELGVKVSRFNFEVKNKERENKLEMFEKGMIQVLVAIKCLDEGVDIPATQRAYFLASTSNPREFVQRRGRILRKAEGKKYAEIHDYIVLPIGLGFDDFERIASKELPRFSEFSSHATNYSTSKKEMISILNGYNLTPLLYKKPWDVYKEQKEKYLNDND